VLAVFHVSECVSSAIAAGNTKKITFHLRTHVMLDDSYLIHPYGLTCIGTDAIRRPRFDYTRLVGWSSQPSFFLCLLDVLVLHLIFIHRVFCRKDFIGLLTAIHYECVVDDADGMITVAKLELTDERFTLPPLPSFSFHSFVFYFFMLMSLSVMYVEERLDVILRDLFLMISKNS